MLREATSEVQKMIPFKFVLLNKVGDAERLIDHILAISSAVAEVSPTYVFSSICIDILLQLSTPAKIATSALNGLFTVSTRTISHLLLLKRD